MANFSTGPLAGRVGNLILSQMKRPARPLFGILLLAAVALTCRTLVRRCFSLSDLDARRLRLPLVPPPVINSTILRFAETDLAEPKFKQDTEQLLEGNIDSFSRYRTFATWRRSNRREEVPARTSKGLPVTSRSPLFYRYWLDFRRNLQNWSRNKRFQDDILLDLVMLLKHPLDRHRGFPVSSDRKYSTCAVVGNSGILLQSDYGTLIDSHEVVIRLNNARIDGYGNKVGSKTSFSFVNSNILHLCAGRVGCFCHPYGAQIPIIMYMCQAIHFLDYTMCNSSYKSPLLITDPRFDVLCSRIVKYYSLKRFVELTGNSVEQWNTIHDGQNFHYSSGMQAVMLALGICDQVSVFGFGKSDSAKHHYHTNQKVELHLHDYEAEYDLYRDISESPQAVPFISDKFKFPPMVIYH